MDLNKILLECLSFEEEREWFEFKENIFDENMIGEYISALSNSAAILGRTFGYVIWGISNDSHNIVGTDVDYEKEIHNEPLQHYLARNLNPSVSFYFEEIFISSRRIVFLVIPAAKTVPTAFKNERYIRIGSSKENLKRYPEWETYLFSVLTFGFPTIVNQESEYQDLSFNQLLSYYSSKNIRLNKDTYKENLHLLTSEGKYNIMAQLLSDNSHIPIRVAVFSGKTKGSKMYSVKEFGYKCLLYSLYEVLEYGDILNIPQADETNRIMERKEVDLFDYDVFREAIINAFLHNKWVDLNEPMITVFTDRIEIMSRGTLTPLQTLSGFYKGHSIPVNDKLSEIFLQLHISEKTGRGVPKIIDTYGKKSILIEENTITVIIPFTRISVNYSFETDKEKTNDLSPTQIKVLAEMRNNSHITKPELSSKINVGKTAIDNAITKLKDSGYLTREGSNKNGTWKVKID